MNSYLNSRQKSALYSMFGVKEFALELLEHPNLPNQKEVKRSLQAIANHANKAIAAAVRDLDEDAAAGFRRMADNVELICTTRTDPRGTDDMHFVKHDDLVTVLCYVDECIFCEKRGRDAKNCELRRALLRMQLVPGGNGDCPFWRDC